MKTVNFTLKDVDGLEHAYEVELFSCDENARLQLIVAKPLMQLIATAVGALAPAIQVISQESLQKAVAADGFAGVLEVARDVIPRIDWPLVPDALGALPDMVQAHGGPVLVAQVLARTQRLIPVPELEGLPTISDKPVDSFMRQHLKDPAQRDLAFGDGNMTEYWAAFAMVMAVNFTRIGRSGSTSWKEAVETLTGGLLTQSKSETLKQSAGFRIDKPQPTH